MKNSQIQLCLLFLVSCVIGSSASAEQRQSECPSQFAQVSVHSQAKQCQIFDANAVSSSQSLSYFVALTPQQLIDYYLVNHPQLITRSQANQRTLLTMQEGKTRIAIAADHNGTQVDLLVL